MRSAKFVLVVAVLSLTMLAAGSIAAAEPTQGAQCTTGVAQSSFEAPINHLVDFSCQYRLFFDGASFTYCEDDVILGGVNYYTNYKAEGWSRKEAIADIELLEDRVWIDGIEQQLMRTAYKDGQHLTAGHVVYQQRAFITQLAVGDHVSYWEVTFDGSPDGSATVQLHILPRTDAACS